MICSVCGKEAHSGYFRDTDTELVLICTDCLMQYDRFRVSQKYPYRQIYEQYRKGYSFATIAARFCTNPLVIMNAIKRWENFGNEQK